MFVRYVERAALKICNIGTEISFVTLCGPTHYSGPWAFTPVDDVYQIIILRAETSSS